MPNLVLAVGLTGGHIYPAKALAEQLEGRGYRFLFVARNNSPLAKSILEDAGLPVLSLDVSGMPRSLGAMIFGGPVFLWKQIRAFFLLWRAFGDWRPDALVGFGSYVSFPALLAAKLRGAKTVIFEPNAIMGVANKALAAISDKTVSVIMEGQGAVRVAPPLRKTVLQAKEVSVESARSSIGLDPKLPCAFIFGGSQGASVINEAVSQALLSLSRKGKPFQAVHVTGRQEFNKYKDSYRGLPIYVKEYLEEMGLAYRSSNAVIARSGAMSVLEIAYFGVPAIMVPLGRSAEGHQKENARYLERLGIATIAEEGPDLAARVEAALNGILWTAPAGNSAAIRAPGLQDVVGELIGK